MSPFSYTALISGPPAVGECTTEALDILVDALLCSPDPTRLQSEPVVAGEPGHPCAQVRIRLNGLIWTLTAPQALTASGRLILTRTPFVGRRQAYRFCSDQLAATAKLAAQQALAVRHRSAH